MKNLILIFCFLYPAIQGLQAQLPPPVVGPNLPYPGPNRVEVRFALGAEAVTCRRFSLTGKIDGRVIIHGKFASGFELPSGVEGLPRKNALELELKCGKHRWHFSKVPETAFSPGWWWVGTDYPPFQERFQSWPELRDAVWVRYLMVDSSKDINFTVWRQCPAAFKDQKPGPCYKDD
jgi:hypothetical protein